MLRIEPIFNKGYTSPLVLQIIYINSQATMVISPVGDHGAEKFKVVEIFFIFFLQL